MWLRPTLAGFAMFVLAIGPASQTLWADNGPYTVQDVGPAQAGALAVNASGGVAGFTWTSPQEAFVSPFASGPQLQVGLGPDDNVAFGLHADGWAVGASRVNFFWRPVRFVSGSAQLLAWPGSVDPDGPMGEARAVNDAGVVAGWVSEGGTKAVVWNGASTAALPGALYAQAFAINNVGVVTGTYFDMTSVTLVAFRWTTASGVVDLLPSLGGVTSEGHGINDQGDVVGDSLRGVDELAVLWPAAGGVVELGTFGGATSSARDVNNHRQIVGWALDATGQPRAFLSQAGGTLVDLNTLLPPDSGWVLLSANAINDAGQIAGEGLLNGERRAFLLTPPVASDTTPPVISRVTTTPGSVWPPKHQMVDVTVTVSASDDSGETPVCGVTGVSSSEPDNAGGDGDTAADTEVVGPSAVRVRAERSGPSGSRVYTVTVQCVDGSGNAASGAGTVVIGDGTAVLQAKAKIKSKN